mgnify:CR=1 FL=1
MFRFLRFLTGAALIPLCVAATLSLLDVLRRIPGSHALMSPETVWLLTGFLLWIAMWILLPPPVKMYVVGHELTHVLWGWLFGARAHDLRFSDRGGSVRLSKSNLLITLAPYFFPFYTMLVILAHFLTGLFVNPLPAPLAWLFLIGLTWGFHVTFTLQSLTITQPDIQEYGRLFSYAVIYLINLAGVSLWVVCATRATLMDFGTSLIVHTISVYGAVRDEIATRGQFFGELLAASAEKVRTLLHYRG